MCDDLEHAIELQEEIGSDTTKGAMMLLKTAAKSIARVSTQLKAHIEEDKKNTEMLAGRMATLEATVREFKVAFEKYQTDAVKWQVVVGLLNWLFGSAKRTFVTILTFGIVFGVIHINDVVEVIRALI
jgi:hypothetical protein